MKKLITFGCLILGILFFSNTNALAQSDFKVGGGLAYGLEIEAIGVQVGGVYGFTEELRGAADVSIFFPDSPSGTDNSFWEINANVHYLFLNEEGTTVYGLGGLNYATQKVSGGGFSFSNSEAGLNLGGGAEFGLDFADLYIEAKYAISNYDQLALAAGLRFDI
jgi:hypothetical protein